MRLTNSLNYMLYKYFTTREQRLKKMTKVQKFTLVFGIILWTGIFILGLYGVSYPSL